MKRGPRVWKMEMEEEEEGSLLFGDGEVEVEV